MHRGSESSYLDPAFYTFDEITVLRALNFQAGIQRDSHNSVANTIYYMEYQMLLCDMKTSDLYRGGYFVPRSG